MGRARAPLGPPGSLYDRRAAAYDHLVRSRLYNRLAWSTSPADYASFAVAAIASAGGPLLEVAAGSAAASAEGHAASSRPTVLVDRSAAMLGQAASHIAAAGHGDEHGQPPHASLVQADLLALPFPPQRFATVLGLGLTHLFDDLPALIRVLLAQLRAGGQLHLAGLVAETRRGRLYLEMLHRAGEVARPRTARQLYVMLGRPASFRTTGCMAYATLPAPESP